MAFSRYLTKCIPLCQTQRRLSHTKSQPKSFKEIPRINLLELLQYIQSQGNGTAAEVLMKFHKKYGGKSYF